MLRKSLTLQGVIVKEDKLFILQLIDRDISVRGSSLDELDARLREKIYHELENVEKFNSLIPAPEKFKKIFDGRKPTLPIERFFPHKNINIELRLFFIKPH